MSDWEIRIANISDIPKIYELFRRNDEVEDTIEEFSINFKWLFIDNYYQVNYYLVAYDKQNSLKRLCSVYEMVDR